MPKCFLPKKGGVGRHALPYSLPPQRSQSPVRVKWTPHRSGWTRPDPVGFRAPEHPLNLRVEPYREPIVEVSSRPDEPYPYEPAVEVHIPEEEEPRMEVTRPSPIHPYAYHAKYPYTFHG